MSATHDPADRRYGVERRAPHEKADALAGEDDRAGAASPLRSVHTDTFAELLKQLGISEILKFNDDLLKNSYALPDEALRDVAWVEARNERTEEGKTAPN